MGGELVGSFAGPLIALAAVVAIIAALLLFHSQSPRGGRSVTGNHDARLTHDQVSQPPVAQHGGGVLKHRPSRGTGPSSPLTPASAGTTGPASASTSKPRRHPRGSAASAAKAAVTVLNNSRISGLAAGAASELSARGWTISAVGNLTGDLPQTTLFVPVGDHAAARKLVREFPAISSVQPRPQWLPGSGLTLVLTRYWSS